jgi:hypothetical protein
LTFYQSWKLYFSAVTCGLLLVVCLNMLGPWRQLDWLESAALQVGLPSLVQLMVISLVLCKYSRRASLATGLGVLVTNLVAVTVMIAAAA